MTTSMSNRARRRRRRARLHRSIHMIDRNVTFEQLAGLAGYTPASGGKLNLPATQATADALADAAAQWIGEYIPGGDRVRVTITGAGPVWGYLMIAHALHGRVAQLRYASPSGDMVIWSHGV